MELVAARSALTSEGGGGRTLFLLALFGSGACRGMRKSTIFRGHIPRASTSALLLLPEET